MCNTKELLDKEKLLQVQSENIQELQDLVTRLTTDLQTQQAQIERLQEDAKAYEQQRNDDQHNVNVQAEQKEDTLVSSPKRDAKYSDSKESSFLFEHNNSIISFLETERDDLIIKLDALVQENHRLQAMQSSLHDKLHDINAALQETEAQAQQRVAQSLQYEQQTIEALQSLLTLVAPVVVSETGAVDSNSDGTIDNHTRITNLLTQVRERILFVQQSHQTQEAHHKQTLLDAKQIITVLEEELQRERSLLAKKDNKHKHALQKLQRKKTYISIVDLLYVVMMISVFSFYVSDRIAR